MRALLLSLLVAAPAGAQTFRLVDPSLTVDNRRVGVAGAPLLQEPFGVLALSVPGAGVFRVSAAPFDGAAAAGEFDGDGLFFAVDGTSVRLRSAGPILEGRATAPAFVRFDALPGATARTRGTGLVRASVSDTPGGTPRSSADIAGRAEAPRGPAPIARPTSDPRAEADALRQTLGRVQAERAALEAERDRLRAQRVLHPGTADALAQATARADALASESDRLRAERDQLAAALDRAEADRADRAGQLGDARARADAARGAAAQAAATGDLDRLRADVVARDQTVAALRIESDDRRIRLAETDAALGQAQRALAAMTVERDAALAARDAAITERDVARRGARQPDLSAALATERADLDAARARLDADRASLAAMPAGDPSALLAERQRLLDQIAAVQTDRDALRLQVATLQSDRDRLAGDVARLSADLATERAASAALRSGASAPAPTAASTPSTAPAATPRSGAPVASFPGFDFGRLSNPDAVRRRVDEAEYPRWAAEGRITGDVLVLFEADASGRVVRTAVATPIGGGLDGLAESLVRDMEFVAPVVDGLATGLRSQVLVRFTL